MSSRPPSAFLMERTMAQLQEARQRLLEIEPDIEQDERAYADNLEGMAEGDAFDVLDRLIRASLEADTLAKAAKERANAIRERAARFERHSTAYRSMVLGAMTTLALPKLVRPEFTAFVRTGTPGVVITDETKLADAYVRVTRAPDKTAIGAALKAGDTVPGAELRNAQPHLSVKT